jgi:hypothetical protein
MNPLLLPYIFNILVLMPVGPTTLLGGESGGRLVFQGRFPESSGIRTTLPDCCTTVSEILHKIALHALSTRVKLVPSNEGLRLPPSSGSPRKSDEAT